MIHFISKLMLNITLYITLYITLSKFPCQRRLFCSHITCATSRSAEERTLTVISSVILGSYFTIYLSYFTTHFSYFTEETLT